MEASTSTPKPCPNRPGMCPWVSRAPLMVQSNPSEQQQQQPPPQQNENTHSCCANQQHQMNMTCIPKPPPSLHESSSQFFYFLRLMQLFPDVHPATIHTVLVLCKSDFFRAVDKLLYAKRCTQTFRNCRNAPQKAQNVSGQTVPLDVSVKKVGQKKKISLQRNRARSKDKFDLPPVVSPKCKLPIRPLSPLTSFPEDLSNQNAVKEG